MAADADRTATVPTLSLDERDRRWADVRERMVQRGLDALLVWSNDRFWGLGRANLRYLTHVPGQQGNSVGVFPVVDDPVVFSDVDLMHRPFNVYDVYQHWVDDVRTYRGLDPVIDELRARDLDGARLGIVSYGSLLAQPNIPHRHYAKLQKALPDAELVDATDLVERARLIKSEEELDMLREAADIARLMLDAFLTAEPGQTEAELYADMVHAHIANGGEAYIFNFLDSGSPTAPPPQHLLHAKSQPLAPSTRELQHGDLVKTEFHADYGGYLVAVEKAIALGTVPDELRNVHEVCLACLESGLEQFRPGARVGDVVDAIRRPALEAGMDFLELGFHGHGLGSPELPAVVYPQEPTPTHPDGMAWHPLSGSTQEDIRLREGMVFGTNIDVNDPSWRNDVGLMYGDTVVVTENGPEKLVETPTDLVV